MSLGHEPGPAGLMAGAQPGAIVAVEVFVEEDVVAPVGIGLELLGAAIDGPPAMFIAQEDPAKPIRDLLGAPRRGSSSCRTRWDIRS